MCHTGSMGRLALASLLAALSCGTALAQAPAAGPGQAYPSKPIRLILPFPPGAPNDMVGRALGQKLAEQLGANVVPDNRPGAGGNVGIGVAAKSPPDGYTVVLATPGIAISPSLYSKLGYDAARDFAPVARVTTIPNIMVVHPSVPAKTLKQFIALARAHPGKINFASGGPGTTNHLANELLKHLERIDMVHVPYKGAGPVMPDLIGGHIPMFFSGMPPAMPHVRAGKLRPLAVTSTKRSPAAPDVPTMAEAGVPDFVFTNWFAYFVPAGTPGDAIAKLNAEINRALKLDDVRARLVTVGLETVGTAPEELGRFVREESEKFAKLIKLSGAKGTD